jgi:hypothetical protein
LRGRLGQPRSKRINEISSLNAFKGVADGSEVEQVADENLCTQRLKLSRTLVIAVNVGTNAEASF